MIKFQTTRLHNCWKVSNQTTSRWGLRTIHDVPNDNEYIAGFSIFDGYVGTVFHYMFMYDTVNDQTVLRILDDNFSTSSDDPIGLLTLTSGRARVVSYALVNDRVLICSPDFPPVTHPLGCVTSPVFATREESANPNTTAMDIPIGLVCEWQGRAVIASGNSIFFSDPLAPLTYVAANQVVRTGAIFGIHQATDGALIVCQDDGVWALPASAAEVGQIPVGIFEKRSTARVFDFGNTAKAQGRIWALTPQGVTVVDGEGGEIPFADSDYPRKYTPTYRSQDWRQGLLMGSEQLLLFAHPTEQAAFVVNVFSGLLSWWSSERFRPVGILYETGGSILILCAHGAMRYTGNVDDDTADVVSSIVGTFDFAGEQIVGVTRYVFVRVDNGGTLQGSVYGQGDDTTIPQDNPVADVDDWGAYVWADNSPKTLRLDFDQRVSAPWIEISTTQGKVQSGVIKAVFKGPGKGGRPQ